MCLRRFAGSLIRITGSVALAFALYVTGLVAPAPAHAGDDADAGDREYAVKAAFLQHFVNFVEWPDSAVGVDAIFEIAVLGPDPFGSLLEETFGQVHDGEQRFRIRRAETAEAVRGAELVFVAEDYPGKLETLFETLRGRPVLTVSDREDFAADGGMIGFFIEGGRLRFEVNRNVIEASPLSASSRMLALARIVGD